MINRYPQNLVDNALWLIMDPWEKGPASDTWISQEDADNQEIIDAYFAELLAWRLEDMNHVATTMPGHWHELDVSRHLNHYPRLDTPEAVLNYCEINDINSIVYTGFHLGICIPMNTTGAQAMKRAGYKTYMALDLCCCLKQHRFQGRTIADFEHYYNEGLQFFDAVI